MALQVSRFDPCAAPGFGHRATRAAGWSDAMADGPHAEDAFVAEFLSRVRVRYGGRAERAVARALAVDVLDQLPEQPACARELALDAWLRGPALLARRRGVAPGRVRALAQELVRWLAASERLAPSVARAVRRELASEGWENAA